ncbi:hypothetical protein PaG_00703 [Moesziomyces aphidis]|uniref:Uncharacterized protein n=1 Tax=Moesziomyces aphidis TaxID=84754 RepID=W3VVC2_MOEAP|nr:hypothetical protein PaG_00703 [Moesziomyces aphidis]
MTVGTTKAARREERGASPSNLGWDEGLAADFVTALAGWLPGGLARLGSTLRPHASQPTQARQPICTLHRVASTHSNRLASRDNRFATPNADFASRSFWRWTECRFAALRLSSAFRCSCLCPTLALLGIGGLISVKLRRVVVHAPSTALDTVHLYRTARACKAHQWKPLQPELAWQYRKVPTICTLHALFAKCGLGPIAIRQSPVRRRRPPPPPPPSFFRISLIPDRLFQVPDASIEACPNSPPLPPIRKRPSPSLVLPALAAESELLGRAS